MGIKVQSQNRNYNKTETRKMLPYDVMANAQPFSFNGVACND